MDRSGIRTDAVAVLRKYIWLNGDKTKPCQVVIDEAEKGMAGLQAQGRDTQPSPARSSQHRTVSMSYARPAASAKTTPTRAAFSRVHLMLSFDMQMDGLMRTLEGANGAILTWGHPSNNLGARSGKAIVALIASGRGFPRLRPARWPSMNKGGAR